MALQTLTGRVATGIGMGRTFTALSWARKAFMEQLDIDPHPGTLNLIIDDPDSMPVWVRIRRTDGIRICNPGSGPHDCDAKCWQVMLPGDIPAAIVYPLVPDYPPAQVELISEFGLRKQLGVEDGDVLTLSLRERV